MRSGLSGFLNDLETVEWLANCDLYSSLDNFPILVEEPDWVTDWRAGMPRLAPGARPVPKPLQWKAQRLTGVGGDEIRERSIFYSKLVQWPYIDTYFEQRSLVPYNPPPTAPWFAPLQELSAGHNVPDVIVYITSEARYCGRAAHLIPQHVGRVQFTEARYEEYFDRFNGPKFKVEGARGSSEVFFKRVVGVLGFVRRLNMVRDQDVM